MPDDPTYVGLRELPWKVHDKDLNEFVKAISRYYLRTEASTGKLLPEDKGFLTRNNYATPLLMTPLLVFLGETTRANDERIKEWDVHCALAKVAQPGPVWGSGGCLPSLHLAKTSQAKWKSRLIQYQKYHREAVKRNPNASGTEDMDYWTYVTLPILLGIYPEDWTVEEGLKQQRVLDATTPMGISWQLDVTAEAESERRDEFWEDVAQAAKDAGAKIPELLPTAEGFWIALGIALAGGAVAYGYARGSG